MVLQLRHMHQELTRVINFVTSATNMWVTWMASALHEVRTIIAGITAASCAQAG